MKTYTANSGEELNINAGGSVTNYVPIRGKFNLNEIKFLVKGVSSSDIVIKIDSVIENMKLSLFATEQNGNVYSYKFTKSIPLELGNSPLFTFTNIHATDSASIQVLLKGYSENDYELSDEFTESFTKVIVNDVNLESGEINNNEYFQLPYDIIIEKVNVLVNDKDNMLMNFKSVTLSEETYNQPIPLSLIDKFISDEFYSPIFFRRNEAVRIELQNRGSENRVSIAIQGWRKTV